MNSTRITYAPRPDATPNSSRAAIASCYVYLVERRRLRQQKEGGAGTALRDDTKESVKNGAATKNPSR
jgi:hypothetical protein